MFLRAAMPPWQWVSLRTRDERSLPHRHALHVCDYDASDGEPRTEVLAFNFGSTMLTKQFQDLLEYANAMTK